MGEQDVSVFLKPLFGLQAHVAKRDEIDEEDNKTDTNDCGH